MGTPVKESSGIPQLKGDNFANWQFRVKLHLDAMEVSEALEKDVPEADAERKKFLQLDRKAKSALVSFIADECLEIVREKETAKAMWKALENTFAKNSVASQTVLRKQLARLRMREGSSMRSHFQRFDELVRQLKTAGAKLEENDLVAQLFLTLPDSFDPLVTALENIKEDELTLEKVKQRLLAEEMKRSDRREDPTEEMGAAFAGEWKKFPEKFTGECFRCGMVGHMQRDCRQKPEKSHSGASGVSKTKMVSFMMNRSEPEKKSKELVFYVDSGCSDHLVNCKDYLQSLRKLNEPFVVDVAKDGESLIGEYVGEIRGVTKAGVQFEMKNVVYIPELRANLLSVKKLCESGIELLFTKEKGRNKAVLKHENDVVAEACLRGNLYELKLMANPVAPTNHRRGYGNQQAMYSLVKHDMVNDVPEEPKETCCCDMWTKETLLKIPIRYEQEGENQDAVHDVQSDFEATDDAYREETMALPSQSRREDCVESTTRRSEWERRLSGKFLNCINLRATSAVKMSTLLDPPDEIKNRDDGGGWTVKSMNESEEREIRSLTKARLLQPERCRCQTGRPRVSSLLIGGPDTGDPDREARVGYAGAGVVDVLNRKSLPESMRPSQLRLYRGRHLGMAD